MGYVVPSVLVYQQLASSGGVANVTPDLDAVIMGPCYNVLEYDGTSAASLTLTAGLTNSGSAYTVTDNTVNNVVNLPGQKPGQDVEESSVVVYLNNAVVETLSTKFSGTAGGVDLDMVTATATAGTVTANSATLTGVTTPDVLAKGDVVSVSGAGASGTALTATIVSVDEGAGTVVLDTQAVSSATNAIITKSAISNTNAVTATKRIEAGDSIVVFYRVLGVPKTFTSTVTSVTTVAGAITGVKISDMLPSDVTARFLVSVRKKYNNQVLLKTINGYSNYDDSTVGADGKVTIKPLPRLAYGTVITSDVHIAYRALRSDLIGSIVDVEDVQDLEGKLGKPTERNPLALGVQLALANTVGRILAVAVPTDDLAGYQAALELIEGRRVYAIVPLTQSLDVISTVKEHVNQSSTPEIAAWRVAVVSSAIPTVQTIGQWNASNVNANGGDNAVTLVNGRYILTSSNATFMSDGVAPGDTVNITAATGTPSQIGAVKVLQVLSNQQLQIAASGTATSVSYYVSRTLTKAQQAAAVAGVSSTLKSNRVMHIPQGAGVTIDGVVKYLPGYYLAAAVGGLISGLPVQQSLTNIGLAGIADVQYGNFYFTRAQLGTMAAAGTCLIVQETQGSIPYIRHSLTSDMTTLYYREIQQVKNWDYLSYAFYDTLKGFIGAYNITPDSLRILQQTITAAGRLIQGKKLPKLGAPLLDFQIKKLKQDDTNKDMVVCELNIQMPTVLNYLSLYLVV